MPVFLTRRNPGCWRCSARHAEAGIQCMHTYLHKAAVFVVFRNYTKYRCIDFFPPQKTEHQPKHTPLTHPKEEGCMQGGEHPYPFSDTRHTMRTRGQGWPQTLFLVVRLRHMWCDCFPLSTAETLSIHPTKPGCSIRQHLCHPTQQTCWARA